MGSAAGFTLLLAVNIAAKEIPLISNYVVKPSEVCPESGFYFKWYPTPNAVGGRECFLCFCRPSRKAACWLREDSSCYNPHRKVRSKNIVKRVRRDFNFSDLIFNNTTRNFFANHFASKCKPSDSFSEGCPPDDWCKGCTVCDCNDKGEWDCHVLSFCSEEPKKKKINSKRKSNAKTMNKFTHYKKKRVSYKITTTKPMAIMNHPKKIMKKSMQPTKVKHSSKPSSKPKSQVKRKQLMKPPKTPVKKQLIRHKPTFKPSKVKRGRPVFGKDESNFSRFQGTTRRPRAASYKNAIKKLLTENQMKESYVGDLLVKRVMMTVKKMLSKELDKFNMTLRSGADCQQNKDDSERKHKLMRQVRRIRREALDFGNRFENKTRVRINYTFPRNRQTVIPLSKSDNNTKTVTPKTDPVHIYFSYHLDKERQFKTKHEESIQNDRNTVIGLNHTNSNPYKNFNVSVYKKETEAVPDEITTESDITEPATVVGTETPTSYNVRDVVEKHMCQRNNTIRTISEKYVENGTATYTALNLVNESNTGSTSTPIEITEFSEIITETAAENNTFVNPNYEAKDLNAKVIEISKLTKLINNITANIMTNSNHNNTNTKKKTRFNFLKYLKKLFNQMFSARKGKRYRKIYDEYQTLRILCDEMVPCVINKKNRRIVQAKIKEINTQSDIIFRSIKILKGLLHLIDSPFVKTSNKTNDWKSDIQKLNCILKGTYHNQNNEPLTVTQITQLNHVKQNANVLIDAAAKFTTGLNEIIDYVNHNKLNNHILKRKARTYNPMNITDSIKSIKNIIKVHNLTQSKHLNRIYQQISEMDDSENKTVSSLLDRIINSRLMKVDYLRRLAQEGNSRRSKRQVEGGPIEYMVALMEYLIKKQSPVQSASPDGIDLLIDTIKNAPDIKDIKEKVLKVTAIKEMFEKRTEKDEDKSDLTKSDESLTKENSTDSISAESTAVEDGAVLNKTLSAQYCAPNVTKSNFFTQVYLIPNSKKTAQNSNIYASNDNPFYGALKPMISSLAPPRKPLTAETFKSIYKTHKSLLDFNDDELANYIGHDLDVPITTISSDEEQDDKGRLEWIESNFGSPITPHLERSTKRSAKDNIETNESKNTSKTELYYTVADDYRISDNEIEDKMTEISNSSTSSTSTEDISDSESLVSNPPPHVFLKPLDYGTDKPEYEELDKEDPYLT